MRNWNTDIKKSINEVLKTFLDYLWGIETHHFNTIVCDNLKRFLDYLWGIETAVGDIITLPPLFVFRLPMRNWNRYIDGHIQNWLVVFRLPMRNWNRISAIVGGYGLSVFRLPMRNWNLDYAVWWCERFGVFRLPMRNWNTISSRCKLVMPKFLDYLWGIETEFNTNANLTPF